MISRLEENGGAGAGDRAPPGFPARLGGYDIDLLFQGFPGKSTHNGGLGWSTVVLLRGHGRTILLDTGGPGLRAALTHRLDALGVMPDAVTDVLLSHTHWDHVANYPLFRRARLHVGRADLEWANSGDPSVYAVAEPYARELAREPALGFVEPGQEVFAAIRAELGPGHTPGHLVFTLSGADRDVIFAQDAAKSRAELATRATDLTLDAAQSRATIERIWTLWRARPGNVVVPGHDLPMVLDGPRIRPLGERKAGILAFLGESLDDETIFPLVKR